MGRYISNHRTYRRRSLGNDSHVDEYTVASCDVVRMLAVAYDNRMYLDMEKKEENY